MGDFVLDCSTAMAWCFWDEATAGTDELLASLGQGRRAHTPAIWPLEVMNVLLIGERRKRISETDASRFLDLLGALPIVADHEMTPAVWQGIWHLGRANALSSYDASYLELALRKRLPLATLDSRLKQAADGLKIANLV